jgi:hypothetical protein
MKHAYLTLVLAFVLSLIGVAQPCTDNAVILNLTTGAWGSEVDFQIIDEQGSVIFDFGQILGQYALDNTSYSFDLCLPNGCYSVYMYDSFGDGWNGGTLTASFDGNMTVIGDLQFGNFGTSSLGLNVEGCVAEYLGCTDPLALNYNPNANTDDGGCQYPIDCEGGYIAQLYVCAFGNGNEIGLNIVNIADSSSVITVNGLNNGAIEYFDICLDPNGCYEVQMSNEVGANGWYGGYFWITGLNGQLINESLDANTNYETAQFSGGTDGCPVRGCTDETAINYDPAANDDDGSCIYPGPCENNVIGIQVTTGTFPGEISWEITDNQGGTFFSGDSYSSGFPPLLNGCLPDGCYYIEMYDSFGDGWNNASMTVTVNGVVAFSGTMPTGDYISYTLNINSSDCAPIPLLGCTDPLAQNYDANATEDDGSCSYPFVCDNGVAATLYVCTFSNGWQLALDIVDEAGIVVQSINNLGNGAIATYDICLDPTQCYTVNMSNAGGLTGWNNGYFWINAGNGQIINESLDANATSEIANFSINGECGVLGCTDESAQNYNPYASIEDGSCIYPLTCDGGTYVSLTLNIAAFGSEVSWLLSGDSISYSGGNYPSNSIQNIELCLTDGCYTLELFDSFGDGWNGAEMTINGLANGPLTVGMPSGNYAMFYFGVGDVECTQPDVYGCTDQSALNYNPFATVDDGTCSYPFTCENGVAAQMYVCTFGNGANVNIAIADDEGNVVFETPTLSNGVIAYYDLCLEPGVCYTVEMTNLAGENGWYGGYFWINGGGVQYINESLDANVSSETATFSIDGTCVNPGCTDPTALNYNENANEDDGSCVYPEPCLANSVYIGLVSGTFPSEISWNIIDASGADVASGSGDYGNNGLAIQEICLEDGCYTLDMYDSFGDGWNGGYIFITTTDSLVYLEATIEQGSYNSIQFGINNDCSIIEDVAGCTNPNALNYDPAATIDDGSCTFAGVPGLMAASLTSFDPTIEYQMIPNPNPGHTTSKISVRRVPVEDAPIGIDIYDGVGRLVKSQQLGSLAMNSVFELQTSELSSGIYVVVLSNGGSSQAQRLIIE